MNWYDTQDEDSEVMGRILSAIENGTTDRLTAVCAQCKDSYKLKVLDLDLIEDCPSKNCFAYPLHEQMVASAKSQFLRESMKGEDLID